MQVFAVRLSTAAEMMGVSLNEIRRLIQTGTLNTCGSGNGLRINVESLRPLIHDALIPTVDRKPKKVKSKPVPKGYIYLVKSGRYYKIGFTRDLQQRIQALNTITPGGVQLIHSIPTGDMARAESHIHEQFKHRRMNGEWFCLTKTDVATICRYKSLFD